MGIIKCTSLGDVPQYLSYGHHREWRRDLKANITLEIFYSLIRFIRKLLRNCILISFDFSSKITRYKESIREYYAGIENL